MKEYATPFDTLHAASLLSHRSRLEKFRRAIQEVVAADDYVVDIGTGTGVLALMAAKAGARKVTAIDVNGKSLEYAMRAAALNGLDRSVEFRMCHFKDYLPEEKADVVICEMLSSMMLVEQQIPAAAHATQRILKSGGSMIPSSVTVFAVPVECASAWDRFTLEDLRFPLMPQTVDKGQTRDLSNLKTIADFDLLSVTESTKVDCSLSFDALEKGTMHGLLGMFEATLVPDMKLHMEDGWRNLFIPLETPLAVSEGDQINLKLAYEPGVYDSLVLQLLP
jgi:predicted RNA methylase